MFTELGAIGSTLDDSQRATAMSNPPDGLHSQLGAASSVGDVAAHLLDPGIQHTVRHVRRKCRQLFLIYQSRRGRLAMQPLTFLRKTGIHDRNILLFRDLLELNYTHGICSAISSFDQFLQWQVAQSQAYFQHASTTYCLGTSSGAWAAIASGYFLKVPIVWALSPPRGLLKRSLVTARGLPFPVNLIDLLRNSNGVTEYRIYYNEFHDPDRIAAELLSKCPSVRLFPLPEDHHFSAVTLDSLGLLDTLLPSFESVPTASKHPV